MLNIIFIFGEKAIKKFVVLPAYIRHFEWATLEVVLCGADVADSASLIWTCLWRSRVESGVGGDPGKRKIVTGDWPFRTGLDWFAHCPLGATN